MAESLNKILIIHAGGIGDLVMLTPALKILRNNFSNSKIDIFTGYTPGAAEVLSGSDIVNKIFDLNFHQISFFAKVSLIYKLRREKYNLVVVASGINPWKGGLLAFLIGGKNRVGEYRKIKCPFYTRQVRLDGNEHKVKANLNILKCLDIKTEGSVPPLTFMVGGEDKRFAEAFIKENSLQGKLLVGFSPSVGSRQQFKAWPKESFAELGKKILGNIPEAFIFIFGEEKEQESISDIQKALGDNSKQIIGQSLKRAAALIDRCKIFITNDSGLGHVASTTSTNEIVIVGPTIPERTGPVGQKVYIIEGKCSYRYHDVLTPKYDVKKEHQCLKNVKADVVLNKVKEILSK